jgi:hypothetical protein
MHLSTLQKRILRWLYVEHLRAPAPLGAPYQALAHSLPHPHASIARSLRRLARKDLVRLTRSSTGRLQWVSLTAAGHLQVWLLGLDGGRSGHSS